MNKLLRQCAAWVGWAFCDLAFKTDMRGTEWAYRLGNRAYGFAYRDAP